MSCPAGGSPSNHLQRYVVMNDKSYQERLHAALEAARRAGNPYLFKNILRAIEGRPQTLEEVRDEPFFPPEYFDRNL